MSLDFFQIYSIIGLIVGTFSVFILQREFTTNTGIIGMLGRLTFAFCLWPVWAIVVRSRLTLLLSFIRNPANRIQVDEVPENDSSYISAGMSGHPTNDFLAAIKKEIELMEAQAFRIIVTNKVAIKFDEETQSWTATSGNISRIAPELGMALELLEYAVQDSQKSTKVSNDV